MGMSEGISRGAIAVARAKYGHLKFRKARTDLGGNLCCKKRCASSVDSTHTEVRNQKCLRKAKVNQPYGQHLLER